MVEPFLLCLYNSGIATSMRICILLKGQESVQTLVYMQGLVVYTNILYMQDSNRQEF